MTTVEPHDQQLVRTEPTARQTIAEIKAGHMSPLDVIDAAVARIEEVEPKINALPVTCFERARSAARRMADDVARGGDWPTLCGLPLAVKDNTDLAGVPTSGGSHLTAGRVPEVSDPVIAQLESNGAIAIAKSNLCELGGAHTSNRVFAPRSIRTTYRARSAGPPADRRRPWPLARSISVTATMSGGRCARRRRSAG